MTSAIGGAPTEYGLLGRLVADSATVRKRLDTLTRQSSDGLISNTYSGLGAGASVSLGLDRQVASLRTGQANIDAATGRMGVTQVAMTQLQAIAASFQSRLNTLNGLNASNVDSVAADARSALEQMADVLNTRYGDDYIFAGEDTSNPPVPSPETILSSGFFTQIQTAVGQLGANGATATAASTLAIASSDATGTTPFSAYLSGAATKRPVVEAGNGQRPPIGLLANANAAVTSTGASTTGSYMRDLMRSLATLGSLTSGQLNAPEFPALVQDTRASLGSAITAMAVDAGVLGETQSNLVATRANLDDTVIALKSQISASRDVDMAAVLSSLTQTQTQLQASYQLISTLGSLSLTKYLSAG